MVVKDYDDLCYVSRGPPTEGWMMMRRRRRRTMTIMMMVMMTMMPIKYFFSVKWHMCGTDSFVFSLLPQVGFQIFTFSLSLLLPHFHFILYLCSTV